MGGGGGGVVPSEGSLPNADRYSFFIPPSYLLLSKEEDALHLKDTCRGRTSFYLFVSFFIYFDVIRIIKFITQIQHLMKRLN